MSAFVRAYLHVFMCARVFVSARVCAFVNLFVSSCVNFYVNIPCRVDYIFGNVTDKESKIFSRMAQVQFSPLLAFIFKVKLFHFICFANIS